MADQVITKQELIDAQKDVKHAGEAVNTKKVITPRYGEPFKSIPLLIDDLNIKADEVIAQGFYKGFATETLLLAAKPSVAEMRARADDTRKIWRWNRTSGEGVVPVTGTWTDTGPSDVEKAVEEFLEEAHRQGVALGQLNDYYNYLMQRLAQIAVDKGWDASFIVYGDKTQKWFNDLQVEINGAQVKKNSETVSMRDFGGTADGIFHPLSEKYVTLSEARAKYPFVSALTQSLDWAALQLAIDSVPAGTQIDVWDYVTNEPVYVNKKIKFNFKNSITEIEQLSFNKPIFAIQSKNVTSSGNLKGIYKGLRNTELLVLPTSSQSRLSTYYALFSGAARILSAVVSTQGDVSGLDFERIDSDGFFAGSIVNGNKNSASDTDSDTIKIGEINTINTDWGVVPVGFKSMRIDVLRARNIQNIYPSDPAHAIYVSPRSAGVMNGSLSIGLLDVQNCTHTSGKVDKDAFSIRSTKYAYIERLVIDDVAYIGNTRDAAKLEINSLIGSLKSSTTISEITFALSAQTDSSITVNNIDLVSRNASDNSFVNPIFQHSSNGNIEIKSGKIQVLGANPSHISYGTGGKLTIADGVEITYENEIPATSVSRHALVANTGAAFVKIGALQLNGNASRLLDIATADHEVKINPNLIKAGITPLTYVNQGGVYKVSFTNFDRVGYNVAAGATNASAQSCNTFNLLSTTAVVFTELRRPTSGQQYLLRNTGGVTTLGHNDAVNGLILKDAANIPAANWKAILLQCIGDRCYEVQRF